ncbi:MAG: hypothetical protein ACKO5M_08530 [Vulcanococcus sp.]
MTSPRNVAAWLLLGSLTMPLLELQAWAVPPTVDRPASVSPSGVVALGADASLLARGGGGRGGGGGGRIGGGGGGHRAGGGGHRPQTGFQAAGGGLNRGSTRPSGGWSNKLGPSSDRARPSLDRPVAQRDGSRNLNRDGDRNLNRDGNREINRNLERNLNRDVNRNVNRDISRDWNRRVNINDVNLYPGWARPGWGLARPWNAGWYGGWSSPSWGWWGARAVTWGIASLATAAIINDAVDDAIDDHVSYIVVPNSDYQLLYGTVSPAGGSSVSFDVTSNGSTYRLTADCNAGTLNGRDPGSPAEAELLNAACQVAYGST